VCTIERDGQVYIPSGKSQIEADDTITLVGAPESIHKLFRQIKEFRHETRKVMLLGGGRLAERLGQELQKLHIRFTIIEKDMKRCMELKAEFPEAIIVCADGTKPDVLIEEGLEKMDALVALTDSDTTNMVMSSFAKAEGVPQNTTLINEDHFVKMTGANGRTTVIQPPKVTAERIVEYVRWMQNSSRSSEIETLRMISDGQAEAVEFVARSDMDVLNVPLKDLPLKSSVLIAAITRGRQCIIPNGNDTIQVGDHVVVVTTRHGMKELGDILDHSAANDRKPSRKRKRK
jgi:trk system potassium uptake protein TrkA